MIRLGLLCVLGTMLLLPGCGRPAGDSAVGKAPVQVLVAASTRDAVRELAADFSREKDILVEVQADASSLLATQIVHDAPADLFLSAAEKWADFVKDHGFAEEVHPLLGNTLVLVTPRDNPAGVTRPADLARAAVKRLAVAGPTVPAGMYARQALQKLHLWDELEGKGKIVSGTNVRATLAYVERGEVEAGIVYGTDARITDKVKVGYKFPADLHEPIRYPLVLLKSGARRAPARQFYDFLRSARAAPVFQRHGFTWLDKKGG